MITDPKSGIRRPWREWLKKWLPIGHKLRPKQYWTTQQVINYGETFNGEGPTLEVIVHSTRNFEKDITYNPESSKYFDPVYESSAIESGYRGQQLGSLIYVDNRSDAPDIRCFLVPKNFDPCVKENDGQTN